MLWSPCMYLFCRTVFILWLGFPKTCLFFLICLSFSVLCLSNFHLPKTNCKKKRHAGLFCCISSIYKEWRSNYVKHYSLGSIKLLLPNAGLLKSAYALEYERPPPPKNLKTLLLTRIIYLIPRSFRLSIYQATDALDKFSKKNQGSETDFPISLN